MRDPLDGRADAYRVVNDEASRQGKPVSVDLDTRGKEMRRICATLELGAADAGALQEAYDRLIQPAKRAAEDIYYYCVGDTEAAAAPLKVTEWQPDLLELPDIPICSSFVRPITYLDDRLAPPVRLRDVSLSPQPRYDEVLSPVLRVEFDK
jgi:hypothetical protein